MFRHLKFCEVVSQGKTNKFSTPGGLQESEVRH